MKQILSVIQSINTRSLLIMFFAILFIWFIGPLIAIAGKIPLATITTRLLLTFALLLGYVFFKLKSKNHFLDQSTLPNEVKNELGFLQASLKEALRVIFHNPVNFFFSRYSKPWFLVLGPTNSGKTTLLTKSDLALKGLDNLPPMTITATKYINWWRSDEGVFIDLGGRYLLSENNELKDQNSMILSSFIKLLKRYRRQEPISGLIVTINLQELLINTKLQPQLKKMNLAIQELFKIQNDFPIYLVLTRCDLIEGFTEFFEDLGPEERNQIFGLSFPLRTQAQSLPQLFNEQYNALLQKLHDKVIWRIHHENNIEKQGRIKTFPLQMEFLKGPLAKLLNIILPSTDLNLRGIYLTSCLQKDNAVDNLSSSLSRAFDLPPLRSGFRASHSKLFFTNELFRRIIIPESKYYTTAAKINNPFHFLVLLIVFMVTGSGLFVFYHSYQENRSAIFKTTKILTALPNPTDEPLFCNLNSLQCMLRELNTAQNKWYLRFGLQQASHLKNKTNIVYQHLLTTHFLPYIQQLLESKLQDKNEDTSQLYATLKSYLMLEQAQNLDKEYLQNWLRNYWEKTIHDSAKAKQLEEHLKSLLSHPLPNLALSELLINDTRQILNSLPQSKLVLTILQNQYHKPALKLFENSNDNIFKNFPNEISAIYSIANFHDIYHSQIGKTCKEIVNNGNWVLGSKQTQIFDDFALKQLTTEVQSLYLNEYSAIWADILSKIKIEDLQNLNQIIQVVDLLNHPKSPLIQVLNLVKTNTQPISDSVEFTQQVSNRFLSLNNFSSEISKNTYQSSLASMKIYLEKINNVTDIDKSSYDAAKIRMENHGENDAITSVLRQAKILPEPLQTWYTTIAAESWRIILKNTQNYLNRVWISSVLPTYQTMLDKRYPLFRESTMDISLSDFANFFAVDGVMDTFFKNYLQPFVDNSRLYWEWKNVDGQRVNISQLSLEMFIRAALIQKMFFPENVKIPTINFSLVPVELATNVRSFALNLEGQMVLFQKDNEQITSLTWPGPQPNHVEIALIVDEGKRLTLAESGAWALFKILDKAHLESTANPKHYKLTFDLNGYLVRYELFTNAIVNPFIPGILNAFRCPDNL